MQHRYQLALLGIGIGVFFITNSSLAANTQVPENKSPSACSGSMSKADCHRWYDMAEKEQPDACAGQKTGSRRCGEWHAVKKYVAPAPPPPKPKPLILHGVNFELDSSEIRSESYSVLDQNVAMLQSHPNSNIEVVGHTDSTGSDAYNQNLSEARANSVMKYFVAKGVSQGRLTASGKGESSPVADNANKEGRAQNRRIELHR